MADEIIVIEGPEGPVEFPATMSEAEIEAAMREAYPPQQEPAPRSAIGAFNEGLLNELMAAQQGTSPVTRTLTGEPTYQPVGELLTMETDIGPANTVIQTAPGEYATYDPEQHAIFSEGGRVMVFQRNPEMEEGRLLRSARLLGLGTLAPSPAMAPGGIRNLPVPSQGAPAPRVSQMQRNVEAMEQAGVAPTVPLVTDAPGARMATQAVGGVPFAGGPIREGLDLTEGQMIDALDDVIGQYGSSRLASEGGEQAMLGAEEWVERWRDLGRRAEERLRDQFSGPDPNVATNVPTVPGTNVPMRAGAARIPVSQFSDALSRPFTRWDNPDLAQAYPQEWLDNWRGIVNRADGELTYDDLINLRGEIGRDLARPVVVADKDRAQLERLYGALSDDLQTYADSVSPQLGNEVRRRNQYWRSGYERIENYLKQPLKPNVNPEAVFERIMAISKEKGRSANYNELVELRRTMGPDRWNELASSILSRMWRTTPGKAATQGEQSITSFMTSWNTMSDRAKDLLFSGREQARRNLDNLVENVFPRLEAVREYENVSRTGNVVTGAGLGALAFFGDVMTAIGTGVGANMAARALMNPRFTRWLSRMATRAERVGEAARAAPANVARGVAAGARSPAFYAQSLPRLRAIVQEAPELAPILPEIEGLAISSTPQPPGQATPD